MSRPILTLFIKSQKTKPPPQIKMSWTLLSRQDKLFYCDFLESSIRRDNKEMLSISQIQISPSMLLRSIYQGIERKYSGPEQVRLGYRVISAVGVTEDVLVWFIEGYEKVLIY